MFLPTTIYLISLFSSFSSDERSSVHVAEGLLNQRRVSISGVINDSYEKDSITLRIIIPAQRESKSYTVPLNLKQYTFNILIPEGVVYADLETLDFHFLLEPGDNLFVNQAGKASLYQGKGAEKLIMTERLEKVRSSLKKPKRFVYYYLDSLPDYYESYHFVDSAINRKSEIINAYKNIISPLVYNLTMAAELSKEESYLNTKMVYLSLEREKIGITTSKLQEIFKNTITTSKARDIKYNDTTALGYNVIANLAYYNQIDIQHQISFQKKLGKELPPDVHYNLLYRNARNKYSGLTRVLLLENILNTWLNFYGPSNVLDSCINDYKLLDNGKNQKLKEKLLSYYDASKRLSKGSPAPNFILPDSLGNMVSLKSFIGKTVVLDFWFTGCGGCALQAPYIKKVEDYFKSSANIVFINISVDTQKEVWKRSLLSGKYSSDSSISLNAGNGTTTDVISAYAVNAFPKLVIIDPRGNIYDLPNPIQNEVATTKMIGILEEIHAQN